MEAVDVPVHLSVCVLRCSGAPVDGYRCRRRARRGRVRRADRLAPDRPGAWAQVRTLCCRGVRRDWRDRDERLPIARVDCELRPNGGDTLPGGDRRAPLPPSAAGLCGARARGARTAGGVAVRRWVRDLRVARAGRRVDPPVRLPRGPAGAIAVVRGPGVDRKELVHRGRRRAEPARSAPWQQIGRIHESVSEPLPDRDSDRSARGDPVGGDPP